jgi:hypothetical protein
MPLAETWRALHRSRFPELPLDCGKVLEPGVVYGEGLRDWSDKATTPDQARMERYIDRYDLRSARVLHIGIGNSGFAKRFHARVKEIVGTTVDEPEMRVASALALPNYRFVVHNKYSGRDEAVEGTFDFVLDNNPTSPCCCIRHLSDLFEFYLKTLAPGGQIVTDRLGLKWVPDVTNRRWSFDFDDLAAAAATGGLDAFRMSGSIYVLARSTPLAPGLFSRSRHIGRRVGMLPGRIVRNGPGRLARAGRLSLNWVLVSTVPWVLPKHFRPDEKR